ncbi:MAG: D-alanyl-D-alanine carboxypeptidase family protein [Myxococcaceae bacterium]|nr:D-alanyl-D-alanine carboxypeptidase family protein [Myxococcaceae bacterium]
MSHPAVRRLHRNLLQLHKAERARQHDARELRKDTHALKTDRRQLEHHRDVFESNHKELLTDRKALGNLRDARQEKLDALAKEKARLQEQYDASIDPLTGMGDPLLVGRIDQLTQREAEVASSFDARIDAKLEEVQQGTSKADRLRQEIHGDKKDIRDDRREVKQDQKALSRAKERVKNARHHALDHLRAAEYHMGLKQTNRVRKALGLKPVDHVIRPGKKVTAYYNGVPRTIRVVPVGNGEYLRADAAKAFKKMVAAARRDGIHLYANSGFRSMAEQRYLYQLYLSGRGDTAAPPGYSNHQGGVAMDIGGVGGYGTAAYRWLASHAAKYGFRNTVAGEFWHWSYGVNG